MAGDPFIHESAFVEDDVVIGSGTRVWHHCHIRSGARIGSDVSLGKGVFVDVDVRIGDRVKAQNHVYLPQTQTLTPHRIASLPTCDSSPGLPTLTLSRRVMPYAGSAARR